jgi:ligand-binding sensor protein
MEKNQMETSVMVLSLTDLAPLEIWIELGREIHDAHGFHAVAFDRNNDPIHSVFAWANPLCRRIKEHKEGSKYICAVSQQNMAVEARQTGGPVVEECNGGFLKVCVPVFFKEEFVGTAGGCGLLPADGEVDSFLIAKTLGITEEEVEAMAGDAKRATAEEAGNMAARIEARLKEILSERTEP